MRRIVRAVYGRLITMSVVAWLALTSFGAPTPARAAQALRTPTVLDLPLWKAYGHLRRAGFSVAFPGFKLGTLSGCWPRVIGQHPMPGSPVVRGRTVTLLIVGRCGVGSPAVPLPLPAPVLVPDFLAEPVAVTRRWATRHDLYWQARLPAIEFGTTRRVLDNFFVLKQRPRPGSELSSGVAQTSSFRPTPLDITARARR